MIHRAAARAAAAAASDEPSTGHSAAPTVQQSPAPVVVNFSLDPEVKPLLMQLERAIQVEMKYRGCAQPARPDEAR